MLALLALSAPAVADDGAQGFVTTASGKLTGKVSDADGKPLRGVVVHLVSASGEERTVTTGADGTYTAELAPGSRYSAVFVYGAAKIIGTAVTSRTVDGNEAIELAEVLPPKVPAQPTDNPVVPSYTDDAVDANRWARAWLLLDVSATGAVTRVKLLDAPGLGLDAAALRQAFKLKLTPARDRSDRPVASQVVWTFEWPAFFWWKHTWNDGRHLPHSALTVPCKGSGPTGEVYRDCSLPTIKRAITAPWIDKPPA